MPRRVFKNEKYEYTDKIIEIEELKQDTLIINLIDNSVSKLVSGALVLGSFDEKCFQLLTKEQIIIRGFSEIKRNFSILEKLD